MGLFDRKDDEKKEAKKSEKKADFSKVQSGSSTTARPEAEEASGTRSYTVKSGDSLWKISEQMYGDGNDWRRIYEANKDRIQNPDVIQPGWVLTIPAGTDAQGEVK